MQDIAQDTSVRAVLPQGADRLRRRGDLATLQADRCRAPRICWRR